MNTDFFNKSLQIFHTSSARQIGTIAFNLTSLGWVGMNLTIGPYGVPMFVPCAYLQPNFFNIMASISLLVGSALAVVALRQGNLIGPVIALTFLWSVIASVLRECGLLSGALIS